MNERTDKTTGLWIAAKTVDMKSTIYVCHRAVTYRSFCPRLDLFRWTDWGLTRTTSAEVDTRGLTGGIRAASDC